VQWARQGLWAAGQAHGLCAVDRGLFFWYQGSLGSFKGPEHAWHVYTWYMNAWAPLEPVQQHVVCLPHLDAVHLTVPVAPMHWSLRVRCPRATAGMSGCYLKCVHSHARVSLDPFLHCAWAGTRACKEWGSAMTHQNMHSPKHAHSPSLHGACPRLSHRRMAAQTMCMYSFAAMHRSQPLQGCATPD